MRKREAEQERARKEKIRYNKSTNDYSLSIPVVSWEVSSFRGKIM
jgi:hypothetical protein